MYTWYVQIPNNSHSEWRFGCIRTLLAEIPGYDVGDKGKHLLEDICSFSVVRSSRMGLCLGFSSWKKLPGRVDGASFEHYGMRRRKGMVYGWSRNDWFIVGTAIGASTALHMKVWPLHMRRSTWVDGVGWREIEGDWY
jgi:hypothetical protein